MSEPRKIPATLRWVTAAFAFILAAACADTLLFTHNSEDKSPE